MYLGGFLNVSCIESLLRVFPSRLWFGNRSGLVAAQCMGGLKPFDQADSNQKNIILSLSLASSFGGRVPDTFAKLAKLTKSMRGRGSMNSSVRLAGLALEICGYVPQACQTFTRVVAAKAFPNGVSTENPIFVRARSKQGSLTVEMKHICSMPSPSDGWRRFTLDQSLQRSTVLGGGQVLNAKLAEL